MVALSDRQGHSPQKRCHKFLASVVYGYVLFVFPVAVMFTGCALQQGRLGAGDGIYRTLPDKYQKQAADYERRGLLREAMQSWWIVLRFHPDDAKIKEKIHSLRKRAKAEAGDHFNRGVTYYRNGKIREARREFLLTLAYDQNHELAVDYLKKRLQQPVFSTYVVQPGDTARTVAAKEFHDSNKDFLIIAFNAIDSSGELKAGSLLQIPLFGKDFPMERDIVQVMSQHEAMPLEPRRQKNKVIETASPKEHPREMVQAVEEQKRDAERDIVNYQKARTLLEQEEYQQALEILRTVDSNFRDVGQLKATTEVFLQQEADAHYRKGISYFLSEDLEKAIMEWEEVLCLRPNHLKAQKDLQNARRMQKRMKGN